MFSPQLSPSPAPHPALPLPRTVTTPRPQSSPSPRRTDASCVAREWGWQVGGWFVVAVYCHSGPLSHTSFLLLVTHVLFLLCCLRFWLPVWEPVLRAASILRHPQLHVRLQDGGRRQDPQGEPRSCGRQDPENISSLPLWETLGNFDLNTGASVAKGRFTFFLFLNQSCESKRKLFFERESGARAAIIVSNGFFFFVRFYFEGKGCFFFCLFFWLFVSFSSSPSCVCFCEYVFFFFLLLLNHSHYFP